MKQILLTLGAGALLCASLQAQVVLDTQDNGNFSATSASTFDASFESGFSIDGANTNRMLVVAVNWETAFGNTGDEDHAVTGIT